MSFHDTPASNGLLHEPANNNENSRSEVARSEGSLACGLKAHGTLEKKETLAQCECISSYSFARTQSLTAVALPVPLSPL